MASKTVYRITAKVTLRGELPFTITNDWDHQDWEGIAAPHRSGTAIAIPDEQFHYDKGVPDERVGCWIDGRLKVFEERNDRFGETVNEGGVVVVLESPHACEYDHFFHPLGPLQNPHSRARFYCEIDRLLAPCEVPEGADIWLVNPIQFQTSLFRLLTPSAQVEGMPGFRDAVWKALWKQVQIQSEFEQRLREYAPSLVINACTGGVDEYGLKSVIQPWLKQRWTVKVASEHVSVWHAEVVLMD